MALFILTFFIALVLTLLVVRSTHHHSRLTADHDLSGPQKFHARAVPRVGGLPIFLAFCAGLAWTGFDRPELRESLAFLLIATLPAFLSGFVEDLTKNVSAARRLFFTACSASLGAWLLNGVAHRTDIPGVDLLMAWPAVAVVVTVFVVTGVANSINIIDGFNGLASMCSLMIVLAIAYVAFQVGDSLVFYAALATAGAIFGFFVWNFPAGLIFLGDGGAYLLGFLVGELSVLLIARNEAVSPLFALLVCAYPIFETLFTIYRRRVLKGVPAGLPDGIHLHTLIHRRLVRVAFDVSHERRKTLRNSLTSPYLWLICLLCVVPAMLWWNKPLVLGAMLVLFMTSYVLMYWSIVRFQVPPWLRGISRASRF